jgi:hypothetical protein
MVFSILNSFDSLLGSDERERMETQPTGSEQWMLNLLLFFLSFISRNSTIILVEDFNTPRTAEK